MYAPLRKFVVFKHHVMIGCYKLYVHIQRVQASFAHAEILGFDLDEPSMYRHGLRNTDRRKAKHESYSRYDEHDDCSPLKLYRLS